MNELDVTPALRFIQAMNQCQNQNNESKTLPLSPLGDSGEVKQVNRSAMPLELTDFSEGDLKRFWIKVEIKGPDDCWEWTQSSRNYSGYGMFQKGSRSLRAHRVSFLFKNGSINCKMDVIHSCDNPPCVNPAHLSQATHQINMEDRDRKMRYHISRGEENSSTRLCKNDILEIRRLSEAGLFQYEIAAKFSISQSSVWRIIHREAWGHI
jgi:hypothetical protein